MNYQSYILTCLLDKYERSKGFVTGKFKQGIYLQPGKDKKLLPLLEIAEEKTTFLGALNILKNKELIDYSWEKYEQGNIVHRISLNLERVALAYHCIGREDKGEAVRALYEKLYCILEIVITKNPNSELAEFILNELEKIEETRSGTTYFSEKDAHLDNLLKSLVWISSEHTPTSERLFSVELYGDSKYFERNIKNKVLSILRFIRKNAEDDTEIKDDDLLSEYGLNRWPEVYEFVGNLTAEIEDLEGISRLICFEYLPYGAYMDSLTVPHIVKLTAPNISKVFFVENKANYEWLKAHRKNDELIIYHGGHYGLMKGRWFKLVYEAVKAQNPHVEFWHWSDIDWGGFNIFVRLQKLVPELQPYKMDCKTYNEFVSKDGKEFSENYRKKLCLLLQKEDFSVFHTVIKELLKQQKTLEQEKIIV